MKKFGHYEVTAELGRGGMGVVYKGFEPSLNRKVAIKCLAKHLLDDKDLVERFTREAKATAALNDPNVIQIYYIGEEEGQPFFAMEYIEGRSLDDLLKGGNTLSVSHAKNILKQACSGLEAAHKIGLVHRDIKPANMMITNDGTLKIVDFGIARTREYGDKLTNTGEFVGTPGYLSPEVCIGKEVDARSDIFSLGIVFYEMLAGKVPFENDSPLGLMLEVVQSEIPDIRTLNNKVDKKTSYILNKMIAKSPDERYQSCSDIIRDLGNTIDNQDIKAIQSESKVVKHTVTKKKISEQITLPGVATVTSNQLVTTQQKQPGSSKLWLIAATLFAVVAAAGFGYYKGYFPIPGAKDDSNQPMMTLADDNLMKAGLTSGSQDMKQTGDDSLAGIVTDEENFLADTDDIANDDSFDETEVINETDNNVIADVDSGVVTEQMLTADNIDSDQTQATMNTSVSELAVENGSGLVAKASDNLVASYDKSQSQSVAESKLNSAPVNTQEKFIQTYKPQPVKLDKGVVVIAFGDPAIANPIEKIVETELKQQNIKVMNELFIPGMKQVMNNGMDFAAMKSLIEKNGGQAMIIANVNYIGSQELLYAGRSSELINAQIDVDTYDIQTGDSIGTGYGSNISYTSLNATEQASDAIQPYLHQLSSELKDKI